MRAEEGESGKREGKLTDERIEALASYYGMPPTDREAVLEMAKSIGVSAAVVRKAETDPRVLKKVKEALDIRALQMVVEIMPVIRRVALDPQHRHWDKAVNKAISIAGMQPQSGGATYNNTIVNAPEMEMSTEELRQALRNELGLMGDGE